MSNKNGHTVAQLAKQLNIPASTIRYYANEYANYIERKPVKGTKTVLYVGQSIDVLSSIRQLQNGGKNKAEILSELEGKYHRVESLIDATPTRLQGNNKQPDNNLQNAITTQQQNFIQSALGTMQSQVEYQAKLIQQYQEIVRSQSDIIDKLSDENKQLKNNIPLLERLFRR